MAARSFLYGGDSGDGLGFNSALITNKRVPGSSSKPRDSFFVSGSSHSFVGSRSMVSFEDGGGGTGRTFFQTFDQEDNGDDEYDDYLQHPEKKRRLKADQVRFLEKSFETENKLEPERKIRLAKELGLQPRQIAIWFQNRRARLKTKQLEKDYNLLQQTYNILKANYKNLLQEKEKLKSQVVDLNDKLLQQETEKGSSDSSSTKGPSEPLQQDQIGDCVNDEDVSNLAYIQEDDDDVNIGVKRPRSLLEQGESSNFMLDEDHSDESLDEDGLGKMLVGGYMLPKIESPDYPEPDAVNSCYLGFPGHDQDQDQNQDQSFGFWSLLS